MTKKNSFTPFLKAAGARVIAFAILLLLSSCSSNQITEPNIDEGPVIDPVSAVEQDGVLEAVTWNIEHFMNPGAGPDNDSLQIANVITIVDLLKADLYAVQEISSTEAINKMAGSMNGFRGFLSSDIPYNQKTGFLFNTQAIDSVNSGVIVTHESRDDAEHYWAGRLPLFFEFDYRHDASNRRVRFLAIVIHAKAFGDEASYNRRKNAAEGLFAYLHEHHPADRILFLGDYNDDVIGSTWSGAEESPYSNFVESDEFEVLTQPLSEDGESSYIAGNYNNLIDHITVSDEVMPYYRVGSTEILHAIIEEKWVENYETTTSDHLPVWSMFDVTQPKITFK